MASILPPFPRFVFTIFEPIALVAGYLSPMLDTTGFVNSQLPATTIITISPTATNRILALQLGNVYGLLAMVGVGVLYATTEAKVVRNFLIACAIADIGHLYVTYAVMYVSPAAGCAIPDQALNLLIYFGTLSCFRLVSRPNMPRQLGSTDFGIISQGLHGLHGCAKMEFDGIWQHRDYAWPFCSQGLIPSRCIWAR